MQLISSRAALTGNRISCALHPLSIGNRQMKKQTLFIILPLLLLFSSCATILNHADVQLRMVAKEGTQLVVNGDTLKPVYEGYYKVRVLRSKAALNVIAFDETRRKAFQLPAQNSFAYRLNAYPGPHLWTGFLIDKKNPRRYTYPRKIQVKMDDENVSYIVFPYNQTHPERSIIFKLSPHRLSGLYMPALEIGFEKTHSCLLSTNLTISGLLNTGILFNNGIQPKLCGYRVALEERLYFAESAPAGTYMSFELDYLNKKEKKEGTFLIDDGLNSISYKDTYQVNRSCYTAYLQIGHQWIFNHFSAELFTGVGLRYRDVETIFSPPSSEPTRPRKFPDMDFPGKSFIISIPLNFRIGLAF